jgi:hypothetical protein
MWLCGLQSFTGEGDDPGRDNNPADSLLDTHRTNLSNLPRGCRRIDNRACDSHRRGARVVGAPGQAV